MPPGIDFSNDPLLQGRNFSYLDTQIKRLGGPNFTHIPINAPKCPFAHFQQDGHMAMHNPVGRVNYEPNSWGSDGGPRESPVAGTRSFADADVGPKQRIRSETFADHYSQARQFYISQTPIERQHIADALVFELSKLERPDIRARMVSHLRNIDEDFAGTVADGLGLELPKPAVAARPTNRKLPASDALSILKMARGTFEGRKVGILTTDGADAAIFAALTAALAKEGASFEVIAPKIAGVVLSDGKKVAAKQKIDGGPSVLYDAVAVIVSEAGAEMLKAHAPVKDFLSDAFVHCKFIGHTASARPLLQAAGIADKLDAGCIVLGRKWDAEAFVEACRGLRHWDRESRTKMAKAKAAT